MTDEEILERLPSRLHPHLRTSLACRILRPVQLGSPEFHFAMSLLWVVAAQHKTRWPEIARAEASAVDPAFVQRCKRIVEHVGANIRRRAARLSKSLDQAELVFDQTADSED